MKTNTISMAIALLAIISSAHSSVGPDSAPIATVMLTDSAHVQYNGKTSIRVMAREPNGSYMAVHVDVQAPNGSTAGFAYYGVTGADTSNYDIGGGAQGLYLTQYGTYTIYAKAADYTLGYERWGTVATATVTVLSSVSGGTYYLSQESGASDSNPGTITQPWRSLAKINQLSPGDRLLLRRGDSWPLWSTVGTNLTISASGTANRWITVGTYGSGSRPVIQRQSNANPNAGNCFELIGKSNFRFEGLRFENAYSGVLVSNSSGTISGFEFRDCEFAGMKYPAGVGIKLLPLNTSQIQNVGVSACVFSNCYVGVEAATQSTSGGNVRDLGVNSSDFVYSGSSAISMFVTQNSVIKGGSMIETGYGIYNSPGNTAIYLEKTNGTAIVDVTIDGVYHNGESDGSGVAMENGPATSGSFASNDYVLISSCDIKNTEGAAVLWLGTYSGYYNIVQDCLFENNNYADNTWVTYFGLPRSWARTTFVSFNHTNLQNQGGAFINNVRSNTPSGNTGRYSATSSWDGNPHGFSFSTNGFSQSGPSN